MGHGGAFRRLRRASGLELQAISLALDELGMAADRVQPLFITVDPEHGAATAGIIHRMFAYHEHGRSVQDDSDCWRVNYFEIDLTSDHDVLPTYRREHYRTLSHECLASGPLPVMVGDKHHYAGCKSASQDAG
jgi:hypothetical protein